MEEKLQQIVQMLKQAQNVWAFTGAGISTESGIPDFRSSNDSLWNQVDPMEVASVDGFLRNTPRFYEFWHWRFAMLSEAQPNCTHHWLVDLERKGMLKGVITQNIDGLHLKAGSSVVYELHGAYQQGSCIDCKRPYSIEQIFERAQGEGRPRCDVCSGLLKPNVVLFGEALPPAFYEAVAAVHRCDLLVVLGTSLEVFPAAEIVPQVKQSGGSVILLNAEVTPMDHLADVVIHSKLQAVIEPLAKMV